MQRIEFIAVWAAAALLASSPLGAQEYFDAERGNFWLDADAVCGLRSSEESISLARGYAKADMGDFHRSWESSSVCEFGAEAYGMKRLPKFSLIGSFGFAQWTGEGMSGSMFAEPWRYPIDVLEFTPGRKSRQIYSVEGGVAAELNRAWRIGALASLEYSNYTKFKDLRYYNYTHDVRLVPGIQYLAGDWSVGATLRIGKSGETIQAEQIGDAANQYYAFLDKGLGRGVLEAWNASGVKLKEISGGLPVSEYSFGAGLQGSAGQMFASVYAEYVYVHAGEEQWRYFDAYGWRTGGEAACKFGHSQLRLTASLLRQRNFEVLQEKRTNAGGITLLSTIGSNEIYLRQTGTCAVQYNFDSALWAIECKIQYESARELAYLRAPYSYLSYIGTMYFDATAQRHVRNWTFGGGLSARSGSASLEKSGFAYGTSEAPVLDASYFETDRAYRTALCAGASLLARRSFGHGIYLELTGYYLQAIEMKQMRTGACITFGYNF